MIPQEADQTHIEYGFPVGCLAQPKKTKMVDKVEFISCSDQLRKSKYSSALMVATANVF